MTKTHNIKTEVLSDGYEIKTISRDLMRDMKIQQAMTGQPVWIRTPSQNLKVSSQSIICIGQTYVTTTPDWNIPNAEYSFKEFE